MSLFFDTSLCHDSKWVTQSFKVFVLDDSVVYMYERIYEKNLCDIYRVNRSVWEIIKINICSELQFSSQKQRGSLAFEVSTDKPFDEFFDFRSTTLMFYYF